VSFLIAFSIVVYMTGKSIESWAPQNQVWTLEATGGKATTPRFTLDEATTPEATTPEATTPEATTPETTTPEATTPLLKQKNAVLALHYYVSGDFQNLAQDTSWYYFTTTPETTTPETTTPETTTPEVTTPESTPKTTPGCTSETTSKTTVTIKWAFWLLFQSLFTWLVSQ
jgi:hypothetical protein